MATKNRRTKGKKLADSSDDDSNVRKKFGNISYVKREIEKQQKSTKKVISKLCDKEESSSDSEQRFRTVRFPFLTGAKQKRNLEKDTSDSDESDLNSNNSHVEKHVSKSNLKVTKNKIRSDSSSGSDFEHEIGNPKNSSSKKTKSFSKNMKIKNYNTTNKSKSQFDSGSSNEFQGSDLKKQTSKSSISRHIDDDYSIVTTPSKSDDENIQVEDKLEILLKNQVLEEVNKIQEFLDELKSSLECQSNYLTKKKVTVVRDSKFIAHKILRIYDSTHTKVQESKKNFTNFYKKWLDTCSKENSTVKIKKSLTLNSDEDISIKEKASVQKQNNLTSSQKKSQSENSDKSEHEEVISSCHESIINKSEQSDNSIQMKKRRTSKKKLSLSNKSIKNNTTCTILNSHEVNENISEDADESCNPESNKLNEEIVKQNKSKNSTRNDIDSLSSSSENESNLSLNKRKSIGIHKDNPDSAVKLLTKSKEALEIDNTNMEENHNESQDIEKEDTAINEDDKIIGNKDQSILGSLKDSSCTQNEQQLSECESNAQVSDCDSENIFSEDEKESEKGIVKKNELEKNNSVSKNSMESSELKKKEKNTLNTNDKFLSSASEVENTPVKSPILSSRSKFRKTLSTKLSNIKDDIQLNTSMEPASSNTEFNRKRTSSSGSDKASKIDKETPKKIKKPKLNKTDEEKENTDTTQTIVKNKSSSNLDKISRDSEKEEQEALINLLRDCDSDQTADGLDEKSLDSNKSVDSTCSTVVNSKIEEIQELSTKKLTKPSQHNIKFPIQSKKTNSIYSDSSSDSAEEQSHKKNSRRNIDAHLPLRTQRRLSLIVRKNLHYKTDKKLRMVCEVSLERLSNKVLKKYARALNKSKQYVANKKFKSITNLESRESKKRSRKNLDVSETFGNDSTANIKIKKKNNNEKNLSINSEEENNIESDEDHCVINEVEKNLSDDDLVTQNDFNDAEKKAKEALLNSSSNSSNEDENTMELNDDAKTSNKIKITNTKRDTTQMEISDVTSDVEDINEGVEDNNEDVEDINEGIEDINEDVENINEDVEDVIEEVEDINEDGEEIIEDGEEDANEDKMEEIKTEKSNWKQDKLLTFNITDTESEEEKCIKSQEKKKTKNAKDNNSKSLEDESSGKSSSKKRGRKKRRIVDSDTEFKKDSSYEESDNISQSEEELENKKKSKRRQKSSDSDTSSVDKKPKSKRKRIKKVASESESDDQDSPGKGRKNIRKVLKDKHVADDTKKAAQDEEERLKRIAERQKLFNEMYDARLAGEAKVDKLVLDFDEETKQELVVVDEELVKRLKPHQAKGIKFMWDACFESLKQIEKSEGSGCIIAHCMGLGKTFQVVTLSHTLLSHEETKVNTVMVVCPLSTVLNWVNEFKTWLKHVKNGDDIEIYELTKSKKNIERKYQLESWQKTGGVLIIGYEMFRNLTSTGKKMRKAMQESIMRSLVDPGADLVVCDEGHLLKNEESALSKAMKLVKTLRRVVLTGTPLQNNLKEYHCMVQFVKPNLLGTKKEFLNRFVNPITNGQFDDSTPYDVKLMKKRAHVLHKMLEGSVQRFDYSVLTPFLPPKQEYVIFVRLTEVQIKMYQHYLDNFARRFGQRNGSLFADFQELQRIWTHPYVLRLNAEKVEKANEKKRLEASDSEGSLKDFIDDASESEGSYHSNSTSPSNSDIECIDSDKEKQTVKTTRSTRLNPKEEPVVEVPIQESVEEAAWWSKFVEEKHFEDLRISTKLTLLFGILKESEQIGDKVLVFSQSLYSLTLIEQFLNLIDQETQNNVEAEYLDKHTGSWSLGLDYFRLDGSTSAENRSAWCKIFNNPSNTRARLFLISTRAGGLGINLTAANRVIIFDASWNPSHDVQSIFRIYRFGQKKPCYVYRFLAAGTMEEKIYNRQVTKLSLACRVVDEQQIERHYSNNDLAELYQFDSYDGKSVTLNLPKDRLLAEIFLKYKDAVYTYHEHDSLLENKEEEELDEEERKQAWLEYEEEKQGKRQMINMGNNIGFNQMLMNMNSFPELESIKLLIQKDYPNLPPEHLESVARQAVYDMYRFVDQQAVNQILNPYAAGQTMPPNLLGASAMQMQQQQQFNQQSQLMNMLNPQQMNYPGVNHMPVYSGRGRPPKHMSMNHMANMRQMQMPMQMPQGQVQPIRNNDEVEVISEQRVTPPTIDLASNINTTKEK